MDTRVVEGIEELFEYNGSSLGSSPTCYTTDSKSPETILSGKDELQFSTSSPESIPSEKYSSKTKRVTFSPDISERSFVSDQVNRRKPSRCKKNSSHSYSCFGIIGRKKGRNKSLAQPRIVGTHYREREDVSEVDSCLQIKVDLDQLEKDEECRQLMSRKVSLPSSKINPYRAVLIIRLIALFFFFRYRLINPVLNAYGLWLTSVICEVWFALSWTLDQLPKLKPVNRETYTDRLCLRYDYPGENCTLACIDVFLNMKDHQESSPIPIVNTVLSILAVDYPSDRITCYVSDDEAALLTLEILSETCQFAEKWVPFCREFNIEPRSPECYFSKKIDLKYKVAPTFPKERRAMKRQYEEFKVQINCLVARFKITPVDGWIMRDGTPWPGNNSENHPAMIQILLGHSEGNELPQLVYVSREKIPGYEHNGVAGSLNSLVRASAVLTNGDFILNLDCNQYINNSKALLEAMCFMMDPNMERKACFVQFPQRFDATDSSDEDTSNNNVFYDIHMKGLDGIQGPFCVGTGCIFNRKALYSYLPSVGTKNKKSVIYRLHENDLRAGCKYISEILKDENFNVDGAQSSNYEPDDRAITCLKNIFGESLSLTASIVFKSVNFANSLSHQDRLKEAIWVISSKYEEGTAWGREVGWMYGSLNSDLHTSLKMHARGWRSIYCMPAYPAFKTIGLSNLPDRLNQVLQCSLGSIEILFSRHCPIWYGKRLRLLQRMAYINATVYPFSSIPLIAYCTLPAICLITGKFIVPQISLVGTLWLMLLFFSTFACGILEIRWSGIPAYEWWNYQQFSLIGGVSAYLFAVIYGLLKLFLGNKFVMTMLTDRYAENSFPGIYAFRWTSLLILPTTIILINMWAIIAGFSSATKTGYSSWGPLCAKLFLSFLVMLHLYPFLKGLIVRKNRIPTVVIVWSLLLASLFSVLWVRVNPFVTNIQGPNAQICGIYC